MSGIPGVARAGTIASPAIYGAFNQARASCVIRNIGSGPIAVEVNIFDESGNVVPPSERSRDGDPVEPERTCAVHVSAIADGVAFACSATSSGIGKLRGTLTLTTTTFIPLRSAELR